MGGNHQDECQPPSGTPVGQGRLATTVHAPISANAISARLCHPAKPSKIATAVSISVNEVGQASADSSRSSVPRQGAVCRTDKIRTVLLDPGLRIRRPTGHAWPQRHPMAGPPLHLAKGTA